MEIESNKNYNKFKMFSGGLPITALLFLTTIGLCNNLGNFIKNSINLLSLKFSFLRLFFLYSSSPVSPVSYKESQMIIINPHIESISGVKNLGR